jgi:hypothetical protein
MTDVIDPVLADVVARAGADPDSVGLCLHGSRSQGVHRPDSDYDILWIVTDEAHVKRGATDELVANRVLPNGARVDIHFLSPGVLTEIAADPARARSTCFTVRILLDKTGEVDAGITAMRATANRRAVAELADYFDEYNIAFGRSLKCWRRGEVLGARLNAARSAQFLLRLLYAAQGRWAPFADYLTLDLPELESAQGWPAGFVAAALHRLLDDADPGFQQDLQLRVARFLAGRDIVYPYPEDLELAHSWTFPAT